MPLTRSLARSVAGHLTAPVTHSVEGAAEEVNLLAGGNDLSNPAWTVSALDLFNAGQPNQYVLESAWDDWHIFRQVLAKPAIAKKYAISAVLNPAYGRSLFRIFMHTDDFATSCRRNFNLATPEPLTGGGDGNFEIVPGSDFATSLGGGEVEVGFEFTTGSEATLGFTGYLEIIEDGENYVGDAAKGMGVREVRLYDRGFP